MSFTTLFVRIFAALSMVAIIAVGLVGVIGLYLVSTPTMILPILIVDGFIIVGMAQAVIKVGYLSDSIEEALTRPLPLSVRINIVKMIGVVGMTLATAATIYVAAILSQLSLPLWPMVGSALLLAALDVLAVLPIYFWAEREVSYLESQRHFFSYSSYVIVEPESEDVR